MYFKFQKFPLPLTHPRDAVPQTHQPCCIQMSTVSVIKQHQSIEHTRVPI